MCGRYYGRSDKQRISEAFRLGQLPDDFVLPPWDYNIAPTTHQPVIRQKRDTGDRELVPDEEIVVQTDDLCRLSGGCDKCPGHALAKDVGLMELNPLETVGCTHGCHRTQ